MLILTETIYGLIFLLSNPIMSKNVDNEYYHLCLYKLVRDSIKKIEEMKQELLLKNNPKKLKNYDSIHNSPYLFAGKLQTPLKNERYKSEITEKYKSKAL